jgi:hypothetical protein
MIKIDNFRMDRVAHHIAISFYSCAFIAILCEDNDLLLMNVMGIDKNVEVDGVDII